MKYKKYLVFLLIAFLQGCNVFDSETTYSEAGIADDGLVIYFQERHEGHSESDPELVLELKTKKILECSNYFIVHELLQTDDLIEIRLLGIDIGLICFTGYGPAYGQVSFENVEGIKELVISDGGLRDRFEINVTHEKVDIAPITATFAETPHNRYYRKPENTFHFSCNTRNDMAHLCQDFHDTMINELDIAEFEFPDDGVNPFLGVNGINVTPYFHQSRFYTYATEDEFNKAGELLESFTHEHIAGTQGNSLSIYNWRNELYSSWSFLNP